ncbi:MAG TPA: acylphosphatase [Planctomycetota bacterium]|nr:acylphosphatase [Planctomycetota bacterium]
MDKTVRAHLYISGTVQGVFFRHYTFERAHQLGLTGWVKNLANGQVETTFEGTKDKVDEMIEWCHKGPPSAKVTKVDIQWETPDGSLKGFNIE